MAYQYPKDVASRPGLKAVTGKFCFPLPVSHIGTISTVVKGVRPLIVGTDLTISAGSGSTFSINSSTADPADWGINPGDYVVFVNTGIDGIYQIESGDLSAGESIVLGPGATVTTGYVYVLGKDQEIVGNGTKFKQLTVGTYVVIMNNAYTPTVQARKIKKIVNDELMYVEQGFLNVLDVVPLLVSEKGDIRGVSIQAGGAGVLCETSIAEGDAPTFYDQDGLEPVYGDSGVNTFKILIQK